MSKTKRPWVFTIFFVGFWSLITLIFDGMLVFNAYRQMKAIEFPVATGTVTHSEVTVHHSDDGTTYGVDVKYKYEVAGRSYVGTQYRYGQMNSSDDSARTIVDSLPIGEKVDVHYNPTDPADSVLITGVQSGDYFLALFLTPFNLVMVGGWYAAIAMFFPGVARRLAGSPRVISRGFKRRLVLEPVPRIVPAAAVLGITAFLSIFIVGFGFGFNPPMTVIKVTWGIVLGLAAAMFMRRPGFSVRGKKLVLDDVENTLSITGNNEDSADKVLSLASVVDVDTSPKGKAHQVQLVYSDEEMAECRETLIEVGDAEQAGELAVWIKDQVLRSARE